MSEVFISKLENKPAICLYTDDESNADVFHFSDERACGTAQAICDELAENEYSDMDICDGYISKTPCLFLMDGLGSRDAKVYDFNNERDLGTACEMAFRYLELRDEEDEEEDGEEDEEIDENARQDAYDDARHVYDAAIANGDSEQDAREKASRVLDAQLKK